MRPFGSKKIQPAWSYNARGVIWHIHPAAGGTLVGEERRIEEKKAVFFCLDREKGQELWKHASLGDAWWIGIEAVYRDTVLFHGFANPNLPQHRGIITVDVLTGKKLWEDQELEFVGVGDDSVVGSRETSAGHSLVELDRRSGQTRRELSREDFHALNMSWSESEEEIRFPMPLDELARDSSQAGAAIAGQYDSGTVAGPVEAMEEGEYVIFDYHELSGRGPAESPLFSSVVKVVERATGTVVYSDAVSSGVQSVIPDLFFVQHGMLYYIKDRRTLVAVRLVS